ncbi:TetR/AcrR family transcriptional regulator [Paucibacter sp. R3-3]|uniref:TetR/AcrR family transcriptional regulator n=1 Tax=Roseateles agri TaxID=3098619 RepID=A0ABU5DQ71_9BURK|nr:TetR/AcrR family transcriptional regulator [Paucibacter sp. R3-3]MDY0747192.1 TetR/AcrR family transcriptional regulator [Paucibacter sp. R3-3]
MVTTTTASSKKKPVRKTAGRPRADEVEARADELARIAGKLFLEKGYSKVSLEMIAREARVAVRTIYVKFGGKPGLLSALLLAKREKYFSGLDLAQDPRPLQEVIGDFSARFYELICSEEALALQRMLAAESCTNPEFVRTFFEQGPNRTRATIAAYLDRPDVRAQLREDVAHELLPVFLINCILGDQLTLMLLRPALPSPEQRAKELAQRLDLFYKAVLR